MGTVKSIAHLTSKNEYLYYYIDRNQIPKIEEMITNRPQLLKEDLTRNSKTNALNRACYNGNLELVKLFIQKYKVDPNLIAGNKESALIAATKRNHLHIVRYLLEGHKIDTQYICPTFDMMAIDYAILQGLYEVALTLYERMSEKGRKELRSYMQYEQIAKEHKYRYVNYKVFLENLVDMVDAENTRDYLTREKVVYSDPVIDPRETWGEWFKRNAEFKDPPIVERSSLPEELQPQNRKFSGVRHFVSRLTVSPLAPQMSLKPTNQTEFQESNSAFKGLKKETDQNLEMQTVS